MQRQNNRNEYIVINSNLNPYKSEENKAKLVLHPPCTPSSSPTYRWSGLGGTERVREPVGLDPRRPHHQGCRCSPGQGGKGLGPPRGGELRSKGRWPLREALAPHHCPTCKPRLWKSTSPAPPTHPWGSEETLWASEQQRAGRDTPSIRPLGFPAMLARQPLHPRSTRPPHWIFSCGPALGYWNILPIAPKTPEPRFFLKHVASFYRCSALSSRLLSTHAAHIHPPRLAGWCFGGRGGGVGLYHSFRSSPLPASRPTSSWTRVSVASWDSSAQAAARLLNSNLKWKLLHHTPAIRKVQQTTFVRLIRWFPLLNFYKCWMA